MPPTSSPWSKTLDAVARFGFARRHTPTRLDGVGGVDAHDCRLGQDWRAYAEARALYEAWSPAADSPWTGFARPTLFSALDGLGYARPVGVPGFPGPRAPDLLPTPEAAASAVVLDLPGRFSVAYAALLAKEAAHEPVVCFNNWPHRAGLVDMDEALGALLHFVPWVVEARQRHAEQPRPVPPRPPVFVLDRGRRGTRAPRTLDFDNRYYHVDADLPSAAQFRRQGIDRVVYVHPADEAPPQPDAAPEPDDLNPVLVAWADGLGLGVATASLRGWRLDAPQPYRPRLRKTVFTTVKDPAFRGYRRAAAGGFGRILPDTSSSGG